MPEDTFRVVVVGAGISGLFIAEKLKRARIDFTVFESADDVGGTWRDNTYPGLYVDVLSRQYEFPFRPNYDWSRKYAPGSEIQAYIKKVANDCGLRKFIRFNERITEARFADGRWHFTTAKNETTTADVFVAATGFLREPLYPDIPGRDSFDGPSFHSALWDHGVPTDGKRWGVIGGGASGIQITEALAWKGLRHHPIHSPPAMDSHPGEPVFDLVGADFSATAVRLSAAPTAAMEAHQRNRPMASQTRTPARCHGT